VKLTLWTFIGNLKDTFIHFALKLGGSLFCTFNESSN